jgi:hypothetical protein
LHLWPPIFAVMNNHRNLINALHYLKTFHKKLKEINGTYDKFSRGSLYKWFMSQPYIGQVWGWIPTLGKSEDLESSGTLECLGFDSKAQNTSHWGVLSVIGKVLKRRYRKWPFGHL